MSDVRITISVAAVLRAFLDEPRKPRYGYDLMRQTRQASGKLYPILARLERAGWLERWREQEDASEAGRPNRVMYRLTGEGTARARIGLAELHQELGLRGSAWSRRRCSKPGPQAGTS